MLDEPRNESGVPTLAPGEFDRLLTAAFARVAPQAHEDPDRPVIGDARLEVLEPLGHGGLGAVYLCRDRRMRREVALKILRARHAGNLLARDGLLWESRLGARLDHPGIVPVHEIGVDDTGRPYFTMRVVRGRTLRAVLLTERTGDAGHARLLRVLLQIAEAVAYAHKTGVVHSDLKPDNVMVGASGEVLVLDWGLARSLHSDDDGRPSSASSKAGTPAYMAPERAATSPPPLAPTVDVFALGVMLLEVLTGPEAGATTGDVTAAAGSGARLETRLGGGEPAELRALAHDSVAVRPEERPADAAAFAARLAATLEHLEEDARQARLEAAAASARATAERRARRTVQTLSIAVLITAAIAGASWLRADRVREQRRAAEVAAVQEALDESYSLTAGIDPLANLAPLREASALLARTAGGLDAELVPLEWEQRLETRCAELAAQVSAAEAEAAERRWREELRAALGAARLRGTSGVHSSAMGRAFAAAFEAAGINAAATTGAELGSPYALDSLLADVVDALDTWAMFGFSVGSNVADAEWLRLSLLVQGLDPQEDRREVRAASIARDVPALEGLVPSPSSAPFQSPTTYVLLGASLAGNGDLPRAHAVWRAGCFAFPDDPWCHVLLGYERDTIGVDSAREHLWAAIALEPTNPAPWTSLGITYLQEGRSEDALRAIRHVVELLPESEDAQKNSWIVQFDLGLFESALVTARRWQELVPRDLVCSGAIIRTLRALGHDAEVLEEEELLVQRWVDEGAEQGGPEIFAEALWHIGALEDARRAFMPRDDQPPEERARRRFFVGRVAMDDEEFEEAIGHFEEVLDDAEFGARALGMQGLALARLERPAEAREKLHVANALGAADPGWDLPTGDWLEVVEADIRLDSVIAGDSVGDDAIELARAGWRALHERDNAARAFELYERAFETGPEAAGVPLTDGAEAAVWALAALEADSSADASEQAVRYRTTAARWLRDHFDELARRQAAGGLAARWIDELRSLETSAKFAPLRDPAALIRLPAAEREALESLWRDVREFLRGLDGER